MSCTVVKSMRGELIYCDPACQIDGRVEPAGVRVVSVRTRESI